jgi:GT2 family glycosyltransferase
VTADVVIPTWNGRALLERCLPTLAGQDATVVVVDNGSTDGTVDWLARAWPDVRVVALDRNLGFAAAVNRGVAAGAGDAVLLVNNDVECDPGFVARLVAPLADPAVGSVAGLLLRPGRTAVDSYGIAVDRTLAGWARCAGAPWPCELDERGLAGPSGGAAAYRRAALEAVGGFDEALFAYSEDVDLALRLRAAGWRAAGAPDAVGIHLGGASFGRRSAWQVDVAGASRAYVLRKWGVLRQGAGVAAWALATEAGVVAVDALRERRLVALRGRVRGWRRARRAGFPPPEQVVDPRIGFVEAVRRRGAAL